jgi:hypothetical protein
MPVGPYEDFPTCIAAIMRKEDVDRESASAICGKMEKQAAKIEVISQGFQDSDPNSKLYIKTFLIDASISGNAWGVSKNSIVDNIHSFIGKPLVLYKNAKGELDHPPDADAATIADWNNIQEPFRIGTIVDVVRKEQYNQGPHDDQYFAIIEITDKDARDVLHSTNQTLYVSPALADLHRNLVANRSGEVVGEESDNWVGMHLALVREPAYGIRKAQITAKCGGSEEVCIAQLRKARLAKQHCGFCVRTALGVTSQVTNSGNLKTLTLSEQDNTKKEETKTTTIEEKKVEESDLERENQSLKQKIAVLETKLQETGELKQQLTARIASLEEREIGRVLEAKVKDADKRREKIRLYVAKGLTASDVEDIYRDVPGAEFTSKKARLDQGAGIGGRATLGQTDDEDLEKANARKLIAGGMY